MSTPINDGGLYSSASFRDVAALQVLAVITAHRLILQDQQPNREANLRGDALAAYQVADALIQAKAVPWNPAPLNDPSKA